MAALLYFVFVSCAFSETALPNLIDDIPAKGKIDLATSPASGIKTIQKFSGSPDVHGVLSRFEIILPKYVRGCYFSADVASTLAFPDGGNRCQPWPFGNLADLFQADYATKPGFGLPGRRKGGMFLILQINDGSYLAMVPVCGPKTLSWLNVSTNGTLLLDVGSLGTNPVTGDVPLLAWSRAGNLYDACRTAWEKAVTCPPVAGRTALRQNKSYPEAFQYLGWCSWEEYKKSISEPVLVEAMRRINASSLPIRYVLVDDGHLSEAPGLRLKSFRPNDKFPHGWAPLMSLRNPDKIRWMGIWFAFSGSWGTLAGANDFDDSVNQALIENAPGDLVPRNDAASARTYYDSFVRAVHKQGFDFVKIDVQAKNLTYYAGSDNAVEASARCALALESATHSKLQGLINCMAHSGLCVFNTRYSAVTRCSMDYGAGNIDKAKNHLHQSFGNMLWLGQTVWGDHDMFHSSDPYSGRMMAVSKALSGGPIYLSDNPTNFVSDFIRPLCYEDGRLLRPLAPGAPLPDSVFTDPFHQPTAFRVVAPLPGNAAAIVAYNLMSTKVGKTISASVSADDYVSASGMIQPVVKAWNVPAEGLIVYDWFAAKTARLDKPYDFELSGFSDRLMLVCPIRDGWAVIGRSDKYLGPAAVNIVSISPDRIRLKMLESGPLAIWSAKGRPICKGVLFRDAGNGLYLADLPIGRLDQLLTIYR